MSTRRRKDQPLQSETSSSSSSDVDRDVVSKAVNVVTPDLSSKRKRRVETDRKKEAKLVKLLLKRRSMESDCESDVSVARCLFPSRGESDGDEERDSIESEPQWAKSVAPLECMRKSFWWTSDGTIPSGGFLEALVGDDPKDLNRFLKWSKWNQQPIACPATGAPVSEWIRTFVLCMVREDVLALKRVIVMGREAMHPAVLTTAFGGHKRTLMHAVCMHPQVDAFITVFRLLLSGSTLVSPTDNFGLTPLHLLAVNSSVKKSQTIEVVHRIHPKHLTTAEPTGSTLPIHSFMLSDHSAMDMWEFSQSVRILSQGTRNSVAFAEKRTPLMVAVTNKSTVLSMTAVGILADESSCGMRDAGGYTSLHISCVEGRADITTVLVPRTPKRVRMAPCRLHGSSPMHVAAAGGTAAHAACIATLVATVPRSEIVSNLKDDQGWPPLLYALFSENLDTVRACIQADSVLVDPTWGEAPQLVYSLHLARKQENRLSSIASIRKVENGVKRLLKLLVSVPEFFDFINKFLKKDISKLAGALSFILEIPGGHRLLSVDNKVAFLHYRAHAFTRDRAVPPTFKLVVPRTVDSPISWFERIGHAMDTGGYVKGQRLAVWYNSETGGLEAGYGIGPTREFFSIAGELMSSHLLTTSPDGCQQLPSNDPATSEAHRIAGRIAALSILSDSRMDFSRVSNLLWQYVVEDELTYEADIDKLASWDPELARSLKWVLENPVEDSPDIQVVLDGEPKYQYINREVRSRICPVNFAAFRNGIFDIFEEEWIVDFLDPNELAVVFGSSGDGELNVEEWRAATRYNDGYTNDESIIGWFWDLVASLPNKERQLLLLFTTGMTAVPIGGFAALTTAGGDWMPFSIGKTICPPDYPLPTAATCFNLLRLPAYPTREILNQKLLTAIRFGSQGFSFA